MADVTFKEYPIATTSIIDLRLMGVKADDFTDDDMKKVCALVHDELKQNKCEAFVKQFEKVYKQTPAEVKEKLANSGIHLETEEQARGLMGLMHLATVMSKGA